MILGRFPDRLMNDQLIVFQPALEDRVLDDVDAAVEAELPHRIGLVGFDRLDAERQARRDFLVAVAGGDQAQDFGFALARRGARLRQPLAISTEEIGGDTRGQRRIEILAP